MTPVISGASDPVIDLRDVAKTYETPVVAAMAGLFYAPCAMDLIGMLVGMHAPPDGRH